MVGEILIQDRIEKIKTSAALNEVEKLDLLIAAEASTMAEYKNGFESKSYDKWQTAERALKKYIDELDGKYFSPPPAFENLMEAFRFLEKENYKIKKSKVYKDRDSGLIRVNPDGSVLESEILKYAADQGLQKIAGDLGDSKLAVLQEEKTKAELERIKIQTEKNRFEMERDQGKYVLRAEVETFFALTVGAIDSAIKNLIQASASKWLAACGADVSKTSLFIDLYNAGHDELMTELARMDDLDIEIGG